MTPSLHPNPDPHPNPNPNLDHRYTRGAVLKAWTNIVEKGCLPLSRTHQVAMLAVDRLQDKSVLVRKAGMQLLMTLVEVLPWEGRGGKGRGLALAKW